MTKFRIHTRDISAGLFGLAFTGTLSMLLGYPTITAFLFMVVGTPLAITTMFIAWYQGRRESLTTAGWIIVYLLAAVTVLVASFTFTFITVNQS